MLATSTRPPKAPDTNRRPGRGTAREAVLGWAFAFAFSGLVWFGAIWALTR